MTFRFLSLPILSIFLTVAAHGALVVAAQNLPLPRGTTGLFGSVVGANQPSDGGELYNWAVGQTFLSQASGQLYSIEVTVDTSAGYIPAYPLMISLVSLVNGQRGEVLTSTLIQPSDIPGGPLEYFSDGFSVIARFNEGVSLLEGTQYGIEFSIPTRPAHYVVWGDSIIGGTSADYYPSGVFYLAEPGESIDPSTSGDYYFRVTVEAPEASSVVMGALGGLILMRRRR
jgi:hypothetical protein